MRALGRGRRHVALLWLLALGLSACAPAPPALKPAVAVPLPDGAVLQAALDHADQVRDQAFASGDGSALASVLTGPALAQDRRLLDRPGGIRLEQVAIYRQLVHEGGASGALEGVLAIRARERALIPGAPPGPWVTIARQWWTGLKPQGGGWLVAEDADLPPAQWWP